MQVILDHDVLASPAGAGLLTRLGRRKTWCLLGFSVAVGIIALAFTALPRTYRASAALMVASNEAVLRDDNSSAEEQRLGDPADIESQMLMLRSPRLMGMILDDPKVQDALVADCEAKQRGTWATKLAAIVLKPPACAGIATDRRAGLGWLESGFSIGPTGRSRVLEVSFVSPVPETSVTVANALIDAYLADDKERKVDTHDNAINWLNSEIARSGQELRAAELGVESYRSQHGIVRGQQASIISERLSSLSQQLAAAQSAYAEALSRLTHSSAADGDSQEVLSNRTVSDLKQQAAQLSERYAELRQRYGESHPALLAATKQINEVNRRLDQESRRVGVSLERDVQAAAARVAELNTEFDKLMRDVGNTGGAEADIAIMVRDVEARREIYVEQLKKVNILQTERRLLTGDARLVNYAEMPDRPWFPKRLPFVAVGTVLASAVGVGVGLLRDRCDRTLRAATNLPKLAGVPIAGYIPRVRQGRGTWGLSAQLENPSQLQEAVRAVFSRCVLLPDKAPKTLMVGSSEIGEGKTFLALSVALFAAATGRRVLVIEADLRRPTFRPALRLPDGIGLSEFLRGKASLAAARTSYRGLDIVTAGAPAIDSTELLSNGRLDALLCVAVVDYDLVILDSPPTLLLMDAQVLARRVDGIIYCASYGRSRLDRVLQGIRELGEAGGRVLGIVVGGGRGSDLPRDEGPGLRGDSYLPVRT